MKTESIINRIRALLAKTVENGCTEAEAMMAAAKAASLMDQYELSPESIDVGQTKASAEHYQRHGFDHPIRFCAQAIAKFTNTTVFRDTRAQTTVTRDLFGATTSSRQAGRHYMIVGLDHEVAIARYVFDICANALDTAAAKALVAENAERKLGGEPLLYGTERKAWVDEFMCGMAARMAETLREMTRERSGKMVTIANGGGRSLVAVRQDLVADWLKAEGITLQAGKRFTVNRGSGFNAGHAAGAGVGFHSGVASGQRSVHAIGGY